MTHYKVSDKFPYHVPTMDEIRVLPWNGYTAISTFSGCGGSSTGYRMAGFRLLWASEFIDAARDSYNANKAPYTVLDGRDIRLVQAEDILVATGLKVGELDLFDGSPPCASFSTAGKREDGWGKEKSYSDKKQRTDDLFFEYARLLRGLQPKTFVAENVSGLIKGTAKGYFLNILRELKDCGYRVEAKVLDAQWLGVPQARQRLIFQGVRNDLDLAPAFPKPLAFRYTVRDALPNLGRRHGFIDDDTKSKKGGDLENDEISSLETKEQVRMIVGNEAFEPVWGTLDQPSPTIMAQGARTSGMIEIDSDFPSATRVIHDTSGLYGVGDITDRPSPAITVGVNSLCSTHFKVEVEPESDMTGYAVGTEWDKLKPGEQSEKYFNLVRSDPEKPCQTVTQRGGDKSVASVINPTERRKFTIAELRRICGFPDDFVLTGTYAQQWERCGRAVPPVMMSYIAAAVRDEVLNKLKPGARAGLPADASSADQAALATPAAATA